MKNKVLMVLICFTLTLSMVLGILAGCTAPATPKPTTPGATTKAPTATTPGATTKAPTTAAPAPTKAGEVFKWRCQSTSSAGDQLYWCQKELCDNIKAASGGRLVWELFPQGAIVARTEVFDAVAAGSIECTPSVSENDWGGKDQLFEINNIPAGMSQWVSLCWMNYHTADDPVSPADKLLAGLYAKFGIKAIGSGSKGPEVNYMANKLILKPSDYKGLTFRGAGWELEVIAQPEFGAKPVFIPSADIYSAIQTGVIDAFESGTASGNWISGYQDVTKYWGFPGMNNLNQTNYCLINPDAWKKLPADLQKIVEMCLKNMMWTTTTYSTVESAKVIPKLVEKGIILVYQTPEVQEFWRKMMLKSLEERGAKYPAFKTECLKALEFQYMMDAYLDLQNPVYSAAYPGKKESIKGIRWQ